MKKLVFVITLLVTFGVSAQDKREKIKNATPEERVEMRTEKLTEKLSLNESQQKQVKEIFAAQQKENAVVRKEIKAEREKVRAEMKELMKKQHDDLKAKLKPVLTAEQFAKWEAMQNEGKEKIKEKRKQRKQ